MSMISRVDDCVRAVTSRGMHCSLNLHRAPGYCINGNERERHNLWLDGVARDAFVSQWEFFAGRYASIPADLLSFDLLNEPPEIGQYGMTRDSHEAIMRRTAAAIRAKSPQRPVVLDGLGGGNIAIPELADLGAVLSTRGYQPMPVTHYRASWCSETRGLPPVSVYRYAGKTLDRAALLGLPLWRNYRTGIEVHVGVRVYKADRAPRSAGFRRVIGFNELGWGSLEFWATERFHRPARAGSRQRLPSTGHVRAFREHADMKGVDEMNLMIKACLQAFLAQRFLSAQPLFRCAPPPAFFLSALAACATAASGERTCRRPASPR